MQKLPNTFLYDNEVTVAVIFNLFRLVGENLDEKEGKKMEGFSLGDVLGEGRPSRSAKTAQSQ